MIARADYDGWMLTFTGRRFYPLEPRVEDIVITDIAHALAMNCRYGGHAPRFYSVAEHCWLLSHAAPGELALEALLHDAPEAFLGADVPTPVKAGMPEWQAHEDRLWAAIARRWGLPPAPSLPVSVLDKRIVADEMGQLWGAAQVPAWLAPIGVTLRCWEPLAARKAFIDRFHELTRVACASD